MPMFYPFKVSGKKKNMNPNFVWLMFLAWSSWLVNAAQQPKNIFILAGQSNMSGRGGVINDTWDGVVPKKCHPNPSVFRFTADLNWVEAAEPLHKDIDVYATCGVGPGMAFANTVLDKKPSLGEIGLVPCAVGATSITQWARGSFLYSQLIKRTRAALNGQGSLRALLWYQGESDTIKYEDAKLYKKRLEEFFTNVRIDLNLPTLPIVQVALASGQGPYVEEVRKGQLGIKLPGVKCIDAKRLELGQDYVHLTSQAEARLGEMFANAFL